MRRTLLSPRVARRLLALLCGQLLGLLGAASATATQTLHRRDADASAAAWPSGHVQSLSALHLRARSTAEWLESFNGSVVHVPLSHVSRVAQLGGEWCPVLLCTTPHPSMPCVRADIAYVHCGAIKIEPFEEYTFVPLERAGFFWSALSPHNDSQLVRST